MEESSLSSSLLIWESTLLCRAYCFFCFFCFFSYFCFSFLSFFSIKPVRRSLLTKSTWLSRRSSYYFSSFLARLSLTPKVDLACFSLSSWKRSSSVSSGGPPLGLSSLYFWLSFFNRRYSRVVPSFSLSSSWSGKWYSFSVSFFCRNFYASL